MDGIDLIIFRTATLSMTNTEMMFNLRNRWKLDHYFSKIHHEDQQEKGMKSRLHDLGNTSTSYYLLLDHIITINHQESEG